MLDIFINSVLQREKKMKTPLVKIWKYSHSRRKKRHRTTGSKVARDMKPENENAPKPSKVDDDMYYYKRRTDYFVIYTEPSKNERSSLIGFGRLTVYSGFRFHLPRSKYGIKHKYFTCQE